MIRLRLVAATILIGLVLLWLLPPPPPDSLGYRETTGCGDWRPSGAPTTPTYRALDPLARTADSLDWAVDEARSSVVVVLVDGADRERLFSLPISGALRLDTHDLAGSRGTLTVDLVSSDLGLQAGSVEVEIEDAAIGTAPRPGSVASGRVTLGLRSSRSRTTIGGTVQVERLSADRFLVRSDQLDAVLPGDLGLGSALAGLVPRFPAIEGGVNVRVLVELVAESPRALPVDQ